MKLHEVSLKFHGKFQIAKLPSPSPPLSLDRKKKSKPIIFMNFEVNSLIRNLWQKKGQFPRAKLSAVKTAAALSPRSGAQRAHSGHHRARHILPRGFDFATFPSFHRLRPPGALQAAAPIDEPCRACRPRSSPLPRSWRQVQARRRAPMAVERQRKVVGLQLPSCLHCCLTCRRRLTMRLQSLIKS